MPLDFIVDSVEHYISSLANLGRARFFNFILVRGHELFDKVSDFALFFFQSLLVQGLTDRIGKRFAIFILGRIVAPGVVRRSLQLLGPNLLKQRLPYVICSHSRFPQLLIFLHAVDAVLNRFKVLSLAVDHLVELALALVARRLQARFKGCVEDLQLVLRHSGQFIFIPLESSGLILQVVC